MLQRRHQDQPQQQGVTSSDAAKIASLVALIGELPDLPAGTLQQVMRLLPQLPSAARTAATQLIVGKVSHDFAVRFLLALSNALAVTADAPATFDMQKPVDQRAITRLIKQWARLVASPRVTSIEALRQAMVSAIGLQMMMDAAPVAAQRSWIFDAGTQYRVALRDAGVLTSPPQWAPPEQMQRRSGFSLTISFTPKPIELEEVSPFLTSGEHISSTQFQAEWPNPTTIQE